MSWKVIQGLLQLDNDKMPNDGHARFYTFIPKADWKVILCKLAPADVFWCEKLIIATNGR